MHLLSDSAAVEQKIASYPPEIAGLISKIRVLLLNNSEEIGEHIKWNSVSFFFNGVMKPFSAKTYNRDFMVINVRKKGVLLVLPTGEYLNDTSGILEGNYTDGRRMITIQNESDFEKKAKGLSEILRLWLLNVERE